MVYDSFQVNKNDACCDALFMAVARYPAESAESAPGTCRLLPVNNMANSMVLMLYTLIIVDPRWIYATTMRGTRCEIAVTIS